MVVGKRARESTLWQSRKVLLCCALISLCNGQYGIVPLSDWLISGFDTATIGGLQAMPGFLAVYGFGVPRPQVCHGVQHYNKGPTTHRIPTYGGFHCRLSHNGYFRPKIWSQKCPLVRLLCRIRCNGHPTRFHEVSMPVV
jgi:hypothetical protein